MASIEDIIKILNGKTALYSMTDGSESAIPKRNFMDVAMEINKLFYEPPLDQSELQTNEAIEIIERWQASNFATRIDEMNPALNLAIKALRHEICIESLIKELDTFCVNYEHYGTDKRANTRRRCCNKCWQELKTTYTKGEEGR